MSHLDRIFVPDILADWRTRFPDVSPSPLPGAVSHYQRDFPSKSGSRRTGLTVENVMKNVMNIHVGSRDAGWTSGGPR
jgi:hypothetical protein